MDVVGEDLAIVWFAELRAWEDRQSLAESQSTKRWRETNRDPAASCPTNMVLSEEMSKSKPKIKG